MTRDLDSGAFAFVMATGIVSVAFAQQKLTILSDLLLAIACLGWLLIAASVVLRLRRNGPTRPGVASLAAVAGTAVLGARFDLAGARTAAFVALGLAAAVWLLLVVLQPHRDGATGSMLLQVVAPESLAVLAAMLAPRSGEALLALALAAWVLGLAVYPVAIAYVARATRRRGEFSPDLWIAMGALAIATVAGSEVLDAARSLNVLDGLQRGQREVDIVTWALASAWIVPLVVADLRAREGWRYHLPRWSFVFPLGMYSVASDVVGRAAGLEPLRPLAHAFCFVALAAWAIVLIGLLRRVRR